VLLIVFGGFAFFGPPQGDGGRGDPIWSSVRHTRALAQRQRAVPQAGLV